MTNPTRQSFVAGLQRITVALDDNLSGKSVVLNGKVWKVADLRAAIQAVIDLFTATTASQAAWRKDVADEKTARASIRPDIDALRAYIGATYGTNSKVYTDFGFVARKQGKPSAKTVATRVEKTLATRKARNTMGKKARLKITGVVQPAIVPAVVTSPSPSAPPATPAVAQSIAQPNGTSGQTH